MVSQLSCRSPSYLCFDHSTNVSSYSMCPCVNQIKPDGVQRGIVGNIVSRFETKGYKLSAMKTKMASKELLDQHYKG